MYTCADRQLAPEDAPVPEHVLDVPCAAQSHKRLIRDVESIHDRIRDGDVEHPARVGKHGLAAAPHEQTTLHRREHSLRPRRIRLRELLVRDLYGSSVLAQLRCNREVTHIRPLRPQCLGKPPR